MTRTVEMILAEWRDVERDHEAAADDELREQLEARILELREEHGRAVAEHEDDARDLRRMSFPPLADA